MNATQSAKEPQVELNKRMVIESKYGTLNVVQPPSDDLVAGHTELLTFLGNYDILLDIADVTGLEPAIQDYTIQHAELADWEGLDTIYVNYGRGVRAYLSGIHELVHIVLRQQNWLQDDVLDTFVVDHPAFTVRSKGPGYKIEQMIAYLIQRDIAKLMDERLGIDHYGKQWGEEKFAGRFDREYASPEREKLGRLIIAMWDDRDPSVDIIGFARSVAERY